MHRSVFSERSLQLFRIQLNNQMLGNLEIEILTLERTGNLSGLLFTVNLKPHRGESSACYFGNLLKFLALLALSRKEITSPTFTL